MSLQKLKKYLNQIETIIPLESLPLDIQEKLKKALEKNEIEADNDEDVELPSFSFMRPEQKALEDRGIIVINDVISKESLAAASSKLLTMHFDKDFNDNAQLIINSPGGYLDACWAFIDIMDTVRMPIRTIAMGEIASAATMIFVAGDERIMAPNSTAMIHNFSAGNFGTYYDLVAGRKQEDYQNKRIVEHFIRHSKYTKTKEVIDNILLDKDNWLTPTEMKKHGLCDTVMRHRRVKKQNKKTLKNKL